MTEYNRFIFSRTLVHSNILRLRLMRAFFDAWLAQNEFLTELNLALSAVHFSFATIFQYYNFVRFCSYSKHGLSYEFKLHWWKPFVHIFFHLREMSKRTWGTLKKTALILSSESVNMLIRGWCRPCAWSEITLKSLLLYSFCIYNNLFPLCFHFYTLLKLHLNCEFTILQFSGP